MHWHTIEGSKAIRGVGFTRGPRLVVELRNGTWAYPTIRTPLCCDLAKLKTSRGAWFNNHIAPHQSVRLD